MATVGSKRSLKEEEFQDIKCASPTKAAKIDGIVTRMLPMKASSSGTGYFHSEKTLCEQEFPMIIHFTGSSGVTKCSRGSVQTRKFLVHYWTFLTTTIVHIQSWKLLLAVCSPCL